MWSDINKLKKWLYTYTCNCWDAFTHKKEILIYKCSHAHSVCVELHQKAWFLCHRDLNPNPKTTCQSSVTGFSNQRIWNVSGFLASFFQVIIRSSLTMHDMSLLAYFGSAVCLVTRANSLVSAIDLSLSTVATSRQKMLANMHWRQYEMYALFQI